MLKQVETAVSLTRVKDHAEAQAAFKSAMLQAKKAVSDLENCIAASRKISASESGIVGAA